MTNEEKAKQIISKILYTTVATVGKNGQPWNSPVLSAYDEDYNFYWASWKENVHSQNVRNNPKIFLDIYDSTMPPDTGISGGVYIQAKAQELFDEKEIAHAVALLYGRKNKKPRKVNEFLGDCPRRFYKAIPNKMWVNIADQIDDKYVDKRIEVNLLNK